MTALLETRGLKKHFGGAHVINGIDFSIEANEIRCVIGPNGAGKSTFFKLITGEHRPSEGSVMFLGKDMSHVLPHERIRMGMSIKFQIPGVFPDLSVRQHLQLSLHRAKDDRPESLDELLRRFMLENEEHVLARNLSHGKKQWLEIAMAVSLRPKLLFLDEPVAGMSVEETHATGELIKRLSADGLTMMVVEHDMTFVKQIASRVTVLHGGSLLADGPLDEILARDDVAEVYLGKKK
ncbi:Lipopolysaccharide export system ATP-binding protein LptB [Paraburkholderia graminis C4D1M]|jgi:branched-chain amino acid transport system ATP-binding protein|uniref:ABC transporter related n=1 Tax=Paraburkholderia graminis (strain ATCC 700544 / DSM 17151 / LMG 18924 / NCIMB 13744 / C4D1M) TaxID=396598 RepID=B1G628_PARG4|nr:ABC transporter ATP-binding protein [Paraburkholderia graminis]EDT08382.1 ABC transporter related [Paraburkholderia graminis C4D1M]CAB3740261.1 Lipopolysaccharide export system ATP-binding protein LptB [Paraburkholderia graminis C4D1M]